MLTGSILLFIVWYVLSNLCTMVRNAVCSSVTFACVYVTFSIVTVGFHVKIYLPSVSSTVIVSFTAEHC